MCVDKGINDIPFDLLCSIVQSCCDGNAYRLTVLGTVSRAFKASVTVINSSLEVVDMRSRDANSSRQQFNNGYRVMYGLDEYPDAIGLLLLGCDMVFTRYLDALLDSLPKSLCVLHLEHCEVGPELFKTLSSLPHLEGLSLSRSIVDEHSFYRWARFPHLKILNVEKMMSVMVGAIKPFRRQLLYLSYHGCPFPRDDVCHGLESCVVLDLAETCVSDAGLQTLLDKGAPKLKMLLLDPERRDSGRWTAAMADKAQERGITVIHDAGYQTHVPAIEECLREHLRDSPQLLKYAKYVL